MTNHPNRSSAALWKKLLDRMLLHGEHLLKMRDDHPALFALGDELAVQAERIRIYRSGVSSRPSHHEGEKLRQLADAAMASVQSEIDAAKRIRATDKETELLALMTQVADAARAARAGAEALEMEGCLFAGLPARGIATIVRSML